MSFADQTRHATVWLWAAVALSLLSWYTAGYPWPICALAVLPLLAPLHGLVRGRRYTYAWATLFAVPYLIFAVTELLVNPAGALGRCAQPVTGIRAGSALWFCIYVLLEGVANEGNREAALGCEGGLVELIEQI